MAFKPLQSVADIAAPIKNAVVGGPFGSNLVSKDYVEEGVPVIRGQNMGSDRWVGGDFVYVTEEKAESLAGNLARPGDLVFTQRGTLGQVAIIPEQPFEKYLISQSQMKLTVDVHKADPLYLYYEFTSPRQLEYIRVNTIQVGVPHTNLKILRETPIELPKLEIQKQIANILGTLDDKIELNRRMNQTLEAMAQAIFQSWFVDFDPVKAKLAALATGRDPEQAAMAALAGKLAVPKDIDELSAEALAAAEAALDQLTEAQRSQLAQTAALFPAALVESELGLIPAGWEVSTIGGEVQILGGGTPSTKNPLYWENGNIHWVTPKDLSGAGDKVLLNTSRLITEEGLNKISSELLPKKTVLMSSRAPVGYLALTQIETAINQGFIAMKCHDRLPPEYVLQWANANMDVIKQTASGSTFAEISKRTFRPFPILVPDIKTLAVFQNHVNLIYKKITVNVRESETLASIRDVLLPELISGKLEIGELVNE